MWHAPLEVNLWGGRMNSVKSSILPPSVKEDKLSCQLFDFVQLGQRSDETAKLDI